MKQVDPPERLGPLARDQFDDDARAMFAQWETGPFKDADTYRPTMTFAHNPALTKPFSVFNIHLLTTSSLPVKERQIAIMRACWVAGGVYAWSSHLRTSAMFGLSPDMYRPIQAGADDPWFTDFERAIVRATDELVEHRRLSDESWAALSVTWSSRQMLDFLFTVGCYVMLAGVMNGVHMQREPELLALAERYGAPQMGT